MSKKMTLSQKKHIDIIGAAKKEFVEYGFLDANMQRIADSAQVSKRTLYRHFPSKSGLFKAVLIGIEDSVSDKTWYQFDSEKSIELQLHEISYQEIEVIYNTYGMPLSRTILIAFLREPEMANELIQHTYNYQALTKWCEDAINAGSLVPGDAKSMVSVYVSLFQGLLFWPQAMNTELTLSEDEIARKIDTVTAVFLQSYGPIVNR